MLKKWNFWKFEITRICVENHASVTGWRRLFFSYKSLIPTFGGRCNRYFWDIRLKILRLPNFNILFQLVLNKIFQKWTVFVFTESWSRDQVNNFFLIKPPIREHSQKLVWGGTDEKLGVPPKFKMLKGACLKNISSSRGGGTSKFIRKTNSSPCGMWFYTNNNII